MQDNNQKKENPEMHSIVNNTLLFGSTAFSQVNTLSDPNNLVIRPQGSSGLIGHLDTWCRINPAYEALRSALTLDMNEYSKILEAVALSFGNYSKHDVSHAKAIVCYIEQLLGESQIAMLSATDTWLILEIIYGHDLGMALTKQEIAEIWNSGKFRTFVSELLDSTDPFLAFLSETYFDTETALDRSAEDVLQRIQKKNITNCSSAMSLGEGIRILVREYSRSIHAERSGATIRKHWWDEETYNGIPNRLYKLVDACIVAHGMERENLFSLNNTELPFVTNGYSADYVHPRFAAMLLRIGDLFDLDNNRFNEYIIAAYGDLPDTSAAHRDKHRCISHLLITPHSVEISADLTRLLPDNLGENSEKEEETVNHLIETFKQTQSWFGYISDELDYWHSHGHEFIPRGFFYPIPQLARRDIFIGEDRYGPKDLLQNFQITYARAQQIFGGKPFYSEPLSFIRELVQNAFDAWKYRLLNDSNAKKALETINKQTETMPRDRYRRFFVDLLKTVVVPDIRLIVSVFTNPKTKHKVVRIAVCDNGEGISRAAYKRMRSVGQHGSRTLDRALIPGWMKPTGAFGIGVHSVFSITEKLNYRSFCLATGERCQMQLSTEGGGRVVLLPKKARSLPDRMESGTDVWFDADYEAIGQSLFRLQIGSISDELFLDSLIARVKEILSPNVADLKVYGYIGVDSLSDLLSDQGDANNLAEEIPSLFKNMDVKALYEVEECYYIPFMSDQSIYILTLNKSNPLNGNRNNICLGINLFASGESMRVSYKGSWVREHASSYIHSQLIVRGLVAELHILGRSAQNTITTQRESLLPDAISGLKSDLNRALRCLLRWLSAEQTGKQVFLKIEEASVLTALAMHYQKLVGTGEISDVAASVEETVTAIRKKLQGKPIEIYKTSQNNDADALQNENQNQFTNHIAKSTDDISRAVCENPDGKYWMRRDGFSQLPQGLHPKLLIASSLPVNIILFPDCWSSFEIVNQVEEFWMFRAEYNPSGTLVIRYSSESGPLIAKTDEMSFLELLSAWKQQKRFSPERTIQYIPAVRLLESPEELLPLAIRRCDFDSAQVWTHFGSFILMPFPEHAKRYRKQDEKQNALARTNNVDYSHDPITFSNLAELCPDYIDWLVGVAFENQLYPAKYSKEQIKKAYYALMKRL